MSTPKILEKSPQKKSPTYKVLWDDLALLPPEATAKLSGAELLKGNFQLFFLGQPYLINTQSRLIKSPKNNENFLDLKTLVLLAYLIRSGKGPAPGLAGREVSANEIPGGSLFFQGPHTLLTEPLTIFKSAAQLTDKALSLGAVPAPPAAFKLKVLPNIEVYGYLEPADDEFPAEARYTFDAHIHYYLPLDAIFGLITIVTSELALLAL